MATVDDFPLSLTIPKSKNEIDLLEKYNPALCDTFWGIMTDEINAEERSDSKVVSLTWYRVFGVAFTKRHDALKKGRSHKTIPFPARKSL